MAELPELIQAMLDPRAYPAPIQAVTLVQTQMSFVFLTKKHVYKVKKPVNLGYLDYTTLAKRLYYCQREVELNRRLCPDAYLGVVPVTRCRGKYYVEGKDKPLEYAVKMRRLPEGAMLDFLLAHNRVTPQMLADVAVKMADFHQRAETNIDISAFGSIAAISTNNDENFSQTEPYIDIALSQSQHQLLKEYTEGFLHENAALLEKRVAEGHIRDCHGDLHAAHICFDDGICIYDCIEFNDRFRYGDTASEIAFLAMDLDHYGRADLSRHFVAAYIERSGDGDLGQLLNFYKCYRACVRGKVACFKLDDPYVGDEEREKELASARSYFELAEAYARGYPDTGDIEGELKKPFVEFVKTELGPDFLLIVTGLPGSYKTETTEEVEKITGLPILRSDLIRLEVWQGEDVFDAKIAANMDRRTQVYDEMFRRAEDVVSGGKGVLLDATFVTQELRRRAAAIAAGNNLPLVIMQTSCPQEVSIARILNRTKENYESNALTEEAYLNNKEKYEPVDLDDLKKRYSRLDILHFVVDTTSDSPQDWSVIGVNRG